MISRRQILKTLASLPLVGLVLKPRFAPALEHSVLSGYELIQLKGTSVGVSGKYVHYLDSDGKRIWSIDSPGCSLIPICHSKQTVDKFLEEHYSEMNEVESNAEPTVFFNSSTNKWGAAILYKK